MWMTRLSIQPLHRYLLDALVAIQVSLRVGWYHHIDEPPVSLRSLATAVSANRDNVADVYQPDS